LIGEWTRGGGNFPALVINVRIEIEVLPTVVFVEIKTIFFCMELVANHFGNLSLA
jgi:hypothetical protein